MSAANDTLWIIYNNTNFGSENGTNPFSKGDSALLPASSSWWKSYGCNFIVVFKTDGKLLDVFILLIIIMDVYVFIQHENFNFLPFVFAIFDTVPVSAVLAVNLHFLSS